MENKLQELIDLQKEQNELLRRHLWRLRFSLLSLLLLITLVAVGLGVVVYQTRPKAGAPVPPTWPAPSPFRAPAGDINIRPNTPGTT